MSTELLYSATDHGTDSFIDQSIVINESINSFKLNYKSLSTSLNFKAGSFMHTTHELVVLLYFCC